MIYKNCKQNVKFLNLETLGFQMVDTKEEFSALYGLDMDVVYSSPKQKLRVSLNIHNKCLYLEEVTLNGVNLDISNYIYGDVWEFKKHIYHILENDRCKYYDDEEWY